MIAYLRSLDYRSVVPILDNIRTNNPTDSTLGSTFWYERAENKPAVVVIHATVDECHVSSLALDGEAVQIVIRTGSEYSAHSVRFCRDEVGIDRAVAFALETRDGSLRFAFVAVFPIIVNDGFLLCNDRRVRLLREDALLIVHDPRLAKEAAWEELHVEANLADIFLWKRFVKVNCDFHGIADSLHANIVREVKVRINHRIEACHVA